MLERRRRRRSNIEPTLGKRLVCSYQCTGSQDVKLYLGNLKSELTLVLHLKCYPDNEPDLNRR